ncbi:MAG: dTMP kinase [Candidatus Marinimicrobia bacterium]|jgi:dTMP kinase|nr:dTMP kinase [Candidatus Neomarinimicrobiota bacterium]MDP6853105.1 dTMP kinase [Candidatus Neomarinimicrobiota bacterium]MDP6936683.1 dTMP kinase [Candidatus Neomarinimicrobiota bacterium]
MRGHFISFEGIDGSGKSTQIQLLSDHLERQGIVSHVFREPGSTVLSEKVREILLDLQHIELNPISESLLFAAARGQLVNEKIKPALHKGKWVICDRYTDSTTAYQGFGRGIDRDQIDTINHIATMGLEPEITFIIDIPPEVASARLETTDPDRMESTGLEFFQKVRKGYLVISKENPHRCVNINGNQNPGEVFNEIQQVIMNKIEKETICS